MSIESVKEEFEAKLKQIKDAIVAEFDKLRDKLEGVAHPEGNVDVAAAIDTAHANVVALHDSLPEVPVIVQPAAPAPADAADEPAKEVEKPADPSKVGGYKE